MSIVASTQQSRFYNETQDAGGIDIDLPGALRIAIELLACKGWGFWWLCTSCLASFLAASSYACTSILHHKINANTWLTNWKITGVQLSVGDKELLVDARLRLFAGVHYALVRYQNYSPDMIALGRVSQRQILWRHEVPPQSRLGMFRCADNAKTATSILIKEWCVWL